MDKRAQGLPITTVILAILGIVVLVILFAIMTGRLTIFAGAANECPGICLQNNPPSGASGPGLDTTRSSCTENIEKEMLGSYIARGVRGDGNKPVVCSKCCQQLA